MIDTQLYLSVTPHKDFYLHDFEKLAYFSNITWAPNLP